MAALEEVRPVRVVPGEDRQVMDASGKDCSVTPEKDLQVAAALEQHLGAPEQHPVALEQHPVALEQHPVALEQHPAALEQHLGAPEQHPAALEQHPAELEQHPAAPEQHPAAPAPKPEAMASEQQHQQVVLLQNVPGMDACCSSRSRYESVSDWRSHLCHPKRSSMEGLDVVSPEHQGA
jgi:hypothetical protein